MPRSCLLGDPYKVSFHEEEGFIIVEADMGKPASGLRYASGRRAEAEEDCKEMNRKAFIEEERYWQNKLDNENISSNNNKD